MSATPGAEATEAQQAALADFCAHRTALADEARQALLRAGTEEASRELRKIQVQQNRTGRQLASIAWKVGGAAAGKGASGTLDMLAGIAGAPTQEQLDSAGLIAQQRHGGKFLGVRRIRTEAMLADVQVFTAAKNYLRRLLNRLLK